MFMYDTSDERGEYLNILSKLFRNTNVGGKDHKSFPGANNSHYVTPSCGGKFVGFAISSLVMASIVVGLRLHARLSFGGGRLVIEDLMTIPAIVFTIFFTALGVAAITQDQFGRHAWDVSIANLNSGLRLIYAQELFYIFAVLFTKLSIIFYIRGLASGLLRKVCDGFFIFHLIFAFASLMAVAFQCKPIRAGYDLFARLDTTCSTMKLYTALTGINMISDVAILLLPVKIVLAPSFPMKRILGISFLFLLGSLACLGGILRMAYSINSTRGSDFSWYFVNAALYGQLEVTFGIIAVSLIPVKLIWHNFSPGLQSRWGSWRRCGGGGGGGFRRSVCGIGKSSRHESSILSSDGACNTNSGKDPDMGQYYTLASPASTTRRSVDIEERSAAGGSFSGPSTGGFSGGSSEGGASPCSPLPIPIHRHIADLQMRAAEDKVIRPKEEKMRNMDFGVKTNLPPEAVAVAAMAAGRVSASVTASSEDVEEEPMSPIIQRPRTMRPVSEAATSVRTSWSDEEFSFPIQSNRSEECVAGRNGSLSPMPPLPPIPPQLMRDSAVPKLHLKLY